jgi:hypothetical protein
LKKQQRRRSTTVSSLKKNVLGAWRMKKKVGSTSVEEHSASAIASHFEEQQVITNQLEEDVFNHSGFQSEEMVVATEEAEDTSLNLNSKDAVNHIDETNSETEAQQQQALKEEGDNEEETKADSSKKATNTPDPSGILLPKPSFLIRGRSSKRRGFTCRTDQSTVSQARATSVSIHSMSQSFNEERESQPKNAEKKFRAVKSQSAWWQLQRERKGKGDTTSDSDNNSMSVDEETKEIDALPSMPVPLKYRSDLAIATGHQPKQITFVNADVHDLRSSSESASSLPTISESNDQERAFKISEAAMDNCLSESPLRSSKESNLRFNDDSKATKVRDQCEERENEGNLQKDVQKDQIQEQELPIQNPSSFQNGLLPTAAKPTNTADQSRENLEAQLSRSIESETPIPPLPSRSPKTTKSEAKAEGWESKNKTDKPNLANDGPITEEEIERARREIKEMQVDPMNIDWGFVILPMPPPLPSPTKTNSDNSTTSIRGRLNRNKKQRFLSSEAEGRETDDSIEDLFDGNENFKQDGRNVFTESFDFENGISIFNEHTGLMPDHEFSTSGPSRPLPAPPRPPRSSISTLPRPFLLQTDFPEEAIDSPEPKFHVPNPDTCYTEIPESKMLPLSVLLARSEQTHAQFSSQMSHFHRTHTAPNSLRSQWQDESLNAAQHLQSSSSLSNSAWAERLRSQFQNETSNAPHLQQPPLSVSNPLGNSTWAQRMRSQFQPPQAAFASDSLPDARFSGRVTRPRIQPPSAVSATNNFHAPLSARSRACLQSPAALTSPEFGQQVQEHEASSLPPNMTRPRPVPRSKPSQTRSATPRPLTHTQHLASSATANPNINTASTTGAAWSTMSSSLPPEMSRIKQSQQAQCQPTLRSKIPPCSITSYGSSSSGSLPGPFKYRPRFIKKKPSEDDSEEKTMNK